MFSREAFFPFAESFVLQQFQKTIFKEQEK